MKQRIAVFIAMFVAASASAGLFETPAEQAQRDSTRQMWSQARDRLREQIAEASQQLAEARAKFWETYPDKPGAKEAQQRFAELLRQKDQYCLAKALGGRLVDLGVEDEIDGGIRKSAGPEFNDLVKAAADRFRAGDLMKMATQLFTAIDCCPELYDAYCLERDWWEFDHLGRVPVGCAKPERYGVCLYHRWAKLPEEKAVASFNNMVELFGKQLVYDAAQKVMDGRKENSGNLVVTAPRPVKIGPGGSEVDDYTVPMPDNVIGTYSNPLVAMELLATQGDDRRYLFFILKSEYHRTNVGRFGSSNKWDFAAAAYDRLVIAFGQKDVLWAANKIRTAKKSMVAGNVMDTKAIGSTRGDPFSAFEDILSRKNPRGYARCAVLMSGNLDSSSAVDAAYKKLIAEEQEDEVLDAAQRMADGNPNLLFDDVKALKRMIDTPVEEEKPATALVDFPDYVTWKKFKPGAKVSYATRYWKQDRLSYQMPVRSNRLIPEMQDHHAYQLQSVNDDQVKLWFTQSSYDMFGHPKPAGDSEVAYPAKYTPPAQARPPANAPTPTSNAAWGAKRTSAPEESGEEIVEINGKRIATHWQSAFYSYDPNGTDKNCTFVVKVWTSDEVPTGLIRRVEDKTCPPVPGEPYGGRFVSETYLESFDGFAPAPPDPSKPVAAAYAPTPAASTPVAAAPTPAAQTSPALALKPVAPQPQPAAVPPKHKLAPPPARVPTPAGFSPEAAAQFELAQRSNQAMFRVQQVKRELTLQGGDVPANIRTARDGLDGQMNTALRAMVNRDNAAAAQALQSMENSLAVIEKYLGQ